MLAAADYSFLRELPSSTSGPEEHNPLVSRGVLTARQVTVAQMVAGGQSFGDIADELKVPIRTVEGHVYRILETLGLPAMADLTEEALKQYLARGGSRSEPIATDFLTVAEIAMGMRVSKMTVYRLVQSGALESVRFGRSYRITQPALQRYCETLNSTDRQPCT